MNMQKDQETQNLNIKDIFEENNNSSSQAINNFFGELRNDDISPKQQKQQMIIPFKRIKKDKNNDDTDRIIMKYKQKNNRRKFNYLALKLEFPLKSQCIFHLSGHILTEINPFENSNFQIHVRQIITSNNFYTLYPQDLQSLNKFNHVIYMLENSQSQESYSAGQLLREYQNKIIEKQNLFLSQMQNKFTEEYIQLLQSKRSEFKQQYIQNYIDQQLKNDSFFIISSVSVNFSRNSSSLENVRFSKGFFHLLGVKEKGLENMLFRKHLLFLILPPASRRAHFYNLVQSYLSENKDSIRQIKDFQFQTMDQINIQCDLESQLIQVPYPQELQFPGFQHFCLSMDNINITKFDVSENQLKSIIDYRMQLEQKQGSSDDNFIEDFEYSMLSQIFIDKYYSQHMVKQITQDKSQNDMVFVEDLTKPRCKYKFIQQ